MPRKPEHEKSKQPLTPQQRAMRAFVVLVVTVLLVVAGAFVINDVFFKENGVSDTEQSSSESSTNITKVDETKSLESEAKSTVEDESADPDIDDNADVKSKQVPKQKQRSDGDTKKSPKPQPCKVTVNDDLVFRYDPNDPKPTPEALPLPAEGDYDIEAEPLPLPNCEGIDVEESDFEAGDWKKVPCDDGAPKGGICLTRTGDTSSKKADQ